MAENSQRVSTLSPDGSYSSLARADDGGEPPDLVGYRNYRLYADESGFHNAPYYGFGALIIAHERRGDLTALVARLRAEHAFDDELKWSRVGSRNLPFVLAVVHEFFTRPWMLFHCIAVERKHVDMEFHDDLEMARRKHWAMFLRKKVEYLNAGEADRAYHIVVDRPPYSYAKADEVAHKIINAELRRAVGSDLVKTLTSSDSREMVGIQIADLFLGAVLAARQGDVSSASKLRVMEVISSYLGWPDLTADTRPTELKFNIWNFQDPRERRRATTRPLALRIPHHVRR